MGLGDAIRRDYRPWGLTLLLAIALVVVWLWCVLMPITVTTIYAIRHAERLSSGTDPDLSPDGRARAQTLAHVLGDAGITAIFVTEFVRTQQTAAPIATTAGVTAVQYQANDVNDVVNQILTGHAGGRVLVVGHSNTVDDIVAGLGAPGLSDLAEGQFDRLFVVHRFGPTTHLDRLRYGAATP